MQQRHGNGQLKTTPPRVGNNLEEELLQLVANQIRRVPIPVIVGAAIISGFASQYQPAIAWGGWFVLYIVLLGIRWEVYRRLPEMTGTPIRKRIRIVILLNGLHGMTWGLSLWFFPDFTELERAIQTILLMTACVGSVSTTAGYRPIFYVFVIPVIVPASLMWALSPGHSASHLPEYLVSALALMFGGLLVGMAKEAFRLFKESFEIRLQQLELNEKLQIALDEAQAASRAKTRFLASASHDLRQPIHTLSLFAAALDLQPLDERSREITRNMNNALQVLASQLDALLDISKLDANVVQVNSSTINVRSLLQRLSPEMENLAREKNLQYRLECARDYCVETDEMLFERILRNIISNAIKYTDEGWVRVSCNDHDGRLIVEIADSGCGIEPRDQAHIFEEFYQVSNPERDRSKGLGLGLAIVRRLTDLLDIELGISSEPGHGSNFSLCLSLIAAVPAELSPQAAGELDWKDLSVLVVDDEEAVRLGMKTLLESLGCRVSLSDSATASLQAVGEQRPDLVLADFRLRGEETGIQVIEELRKLLPGLPAILISGDTAPDRLREAREAGLELLHKPLMLVDLKHAVVEVCKT